MYSRCVYLCLSVRNQYNSKNYEWIFTKLAVNAFHQNISSEVNFEDLLLGAYLCYGPDQNSV